MQRGIVLGIQIASAEGMPMETREQAHAVPGKGLEGDRYYLGTGHFSSMHGPSYEITLIEIEVIEALKRDYDYEMAPKESRRNIVTAGIALNHLVQQDFFVGEVLLRGRRLCEPCFHLANLTHHNALSGLIHRGGLRAQILTEGIIHVGDHLYLRES
ncbi:MAG TPA: MOSC domain-containing protein [Ktedonobacteraceae bacterium]|jgi:MOSC domain-containing protein YiiM|nr:MOSC domain-containing protein [Ktedonobacteraceae bacterium]